MATMSLARKGAIILGATLALATLSGSAEARYYGCWGCGAFAAGAIAGAAIAAPYALRFTTRRAPSTWRLRLPRSSTWRRSSIRSARPCRLIPITAAKAAAHAFTCLT